MIQELQAQYDFDVDFQQLPVPTAVQDLLTRSKPVITLDTTMHTDKSMAPFVPFSVLSLPLDGVAHANLQQVNSDSQILWLGLAFAYWGRYQHTQGSQDLNSQLLCATYALMLTTDTASAALLEIGSALRVRYDRYEEPDDLASALRVLYHAREHQPQGNLNSARLSYELGRAHVTQYGHDGDARQLDCASSLLRQALNAVSRQSYIRGYVTYALACVHRTWYQLHERDEDAGEELSLMEQALHASPLGHPYRAAALRGLGVSSQLLYNRSNAVEDLQKSLDLHYEALQLCPLDSPIRLKVLNGIGIQLLLRYQAWGKKADLDTAIEVGQQVLQAAPNRLPPLVTLANELESRFWLTGNINDLVETVHLARRAVSLCPLESPHRDVLQNNLGECLITRFEHPQLCGP